MPLKRFEFDHIASADAATQSLVTLLQNAHAGEKAAELAYKGHYLSLFVRDPTEVEEIKKICHDEIHHRKEIGIILTKLGAKPRRLRELLMFTVGFFIGVSCLFGGWFIPMYGAGKLESTNIQEYEIAARYAYLGNHHSFIELLLHFAEVEWDHEAYFRNKAQNHWLYKFSPKWKFPPPRENIRESFEQFVLAHSEPKQRAS